jgi:hypothetical protein
MIFPSFSFFFSWFPLSLSCIPAVAHPLTPFLAYDPCCFLIPSARSFVLYMYARLYRISVATVYAPHDPSPHLLSVSLYLDYVLTKIK